MVYIRHERKYFINGIIGLAQPREEIIVTMPDGSERKAKSWETSPIDVAKEVSKSLSERVVIAKVHFLLYTPTFHPLIYFLLLFKVDGELWDLERPLEKPCKLELLDFEHPEGEKKKSRLFGREKKSNILHIFSLGKKVFWHSSAHVLGEAAERHYGCHLCLGPPTDDGFFYEMAIEER